MNKKEALLLVCIFFAESNLIAAINQRDTPRDDDLDGETRRVLREVKMPEGMKPEDWDRSLLMYKIMMSENDNFEFYGIVLDHNKKPIADADVMVEITAFDPTYILREAEWGSETKVIQWTGKTNRRGGFVVTGKGISLEVIDIKKDGFISSGNRNNFGVSKKRHHRENKQFTKKEPAVFTVWPIQMLEESKNLKRIYYTDRFVADGVTRRMDLMTGSVTNNDESSADIIYSLKSDARPGMPGGTRYDWVFTISSTSGGVVETTRENVYLAPTSSVYGELRIEQKAHPTRWLSGDDRLIHIKSHDGKTYSAVTLGVNAFFDGNASISVRGIINTNSSSSLFVPEGF